MSGFSVHEDVPERWWEKFLPKSLTCYFRGHHWQAKVWPRNPPEVIWRCLRCGRREIQIQPEGCITWDE